MDPVVYSNILFQILDYQTHLGILCLKINPSLRTYLYLIIFKRKLTILG